MALTALDWLVLLLALAAPVAVGIARGRRSGSSLSGFFLSGRDLPWWLAGTRVARAAGEPPPSPLAPELRRWGAGCAAVYLALAASHALLFGSTVTVPTGSATSGFALRGR